MGAGLDLELMRGALARTQTIGESCQTAIPRKRDKTPMSKMHARGYPRPSDVTFGESRNSTPPWADTGTHASRKVSILCYQPEREMDWLVAWAWPHCWAKFDGRLPDRRERGGTWVHVPSVVLIGGLAQACLEGRDEGSTPARRSVLWLRSRNAATNHPKLGFSFPIGTESIWGVATD